jgi:antitoxin ParD1/3/4
VVDLCSFNAELDIGSGLNPVIAIARLKKRDRPTADLCPVDLTAKNLSLGRQLLVDHQCDCSWVCGLDVALEIVGIATEGIARIELPSHWHNLPLPVLRAFCPTVGASNMPTRNVVLSERQQEMVETLVLSGRYQNASEVLREGLRLIQERERIGEAKLKALKQAARQGWADVSAGRYVDIADAQLEDFVGQLGRRAAQLAKTAS